MATGHVVVQREEGTDTVVAVWAGAAFSADMGDALLISDIQTARVTYGSLQAQFSEKEIGLEPATQDIRLTRPGVTFTPPPADEMTPQGVPTETAPQTTTSVTPATPAR